MLIRCPDCEFERDINTDNIPPTASLATCPRCGSKFRFRDPETGEPVFKSAERGETESEPAAPQASVEPAGPVDDDSKKETSLPTEEEGDDPLPPGAVIPKLDGVSRRAELTGESGTLHGAATASDIQEPIKKASSRKPKRTGSKAQGSLLEPASSAFPGVDESEENREESPVADASKVDTRDDTPQEEKRPGWLDKKPTLSFSSPEMEEDASPESPEADREMGLGWNDALEEVVPWEQPEGFGFLGSLSHTLLGAMFRPAEFFRAVGASQTSLARPVAFYVLVEFFYSVFGLLWAMGPIRELLANAPSPESRAFDLQMMEMFSTPLFLLIVPFAAIISLFVLSGLYYGFLKLANPDDVDFSTVVRVISYSAAPRVLCVVPFLGVYAGYLWALVLSFVGCKFAFGLSWAKTALALVPLFLLGLALNLRIASLIAGMAGI